MFGPLLVEPEFLTAGWRNCTIPLYMLPNIATPEHRWLEYDPFLLGWPIFRDDMFSFRECTIFVYQKPCSSHRRIHRPPKVICVRSRDFPSPAYRVHGCMNVEGTSFFRGRKPPVCYGLFFNPRENPFMFGHF